MRNVLNDKEFIFYFIPLRFNKIEKIQTKCSTEEGSKQCCCFGQLLDWMASFVENSKKKR